MEGFRMERYKSHMTIPQIGEAGQAQLRRASVVVVGAGGLGSTLLYCLAGAGVGQITVIDDDRVSLSNLNRQFLYTTEDIGKSKAETAAKRLRALNPEITITAVTQRISKENAGQLLDGSSLVLLAVDQLDTRLTVNAVCVELDIPLINGGVSGMYGSVQAVMPGTTPCLACLYKDGEEAESAGSFAPVVSCISALMAQAGLHILLGGQPPAGLLYYDGLRMTLTEIPTARNPKCPVCGAPKNASR